MRKVLIIFIIIQLIFTVSCDHNSENIELESTTEKTLETVTPPQLTDEDYEYDDSDIRDIKYGYYYSLNELIDSGENYEIYSDADRTGYRYVIKDNFGDVIDEGYHDFSAFDISYEGNYLVLMYGYGGNQHNKRYYDVETGNVSRFFFKPVAVSDELIAYFRLSNEDEKRILVVQDIFDSSVYYKEIERDFAIRVVLDECEAEFLNDGKSLKLKYWVHENKQDIEKVEIFDLQIM